MDVPLANRGIKGDTQGDALTEDREGVLDGEKMTVDDEVLSNPTAEKRENSGEFVLREPCTDGGCATFAFGQAKGQSRHLDEQLPADPMIQRSARRTVTSARVR